MWTPRRWARPPPIAGIRKAFLIADAAVNPGGFPVGRRIGVEIGNRHLGYALTWYGLAFVLAVIYAIFSWRREEEHGRS